MPTLSPRATVALILVVGLGLSPRSRAQQPAPEIPSLTIRANTRLVLVDVVVTDKKGQPVPGLKADDFTVEENGKKQKVSVFVAPSSAHSAPSAALPGILSNHPEVVGPAGAPIVLVLDATNSPFKEQAYARSEMLKYAAEQNQSDRPMAILTLTDRLHVLQQFTSDPKVLSTAIKSFKPQEPIMSTNLGPQPSALADAAGGGGKGSGTAAITPQDAISEFEGAQAAYNLERRTLITIEAMRSLSRMLGGMQGRKDVVWLTADLPFDLIPESRNMSESELAMDLPGSQSKSLQLRTAGAMQEEQRSLYGPEIRAAETELANANIAIYPVDLNGLVGGGMESTYSGAHERDINGAGMAKAAISANDRIRVSQGTMEEVAAETGGKAYINQNEIKNGITLAAADDHASYEIGYYPENKKWDGKYRNIKVKLDQGDTQTRYRKGYFAVDTSAGKNTNYEQDVAAALQFNAPITQISFMAQSKATDPGKLRVVVLVDAHTLSAEDTSGNKKLNLTLYACVFDPKGKMLASRSTKVDRAFDAATYQQILDKGMMVPLDIESPQGGSQLRLAVLDNKTGYIGTVSGPLGQ